MESVLEKLKDKVRTVENFPKPGISFKDITPLLSDPETMNDLLDILYHKYKDQGYTKICGIEARGFILGSALANKLNAGFIPIRKKGKLPYKTIEKSYDLEYGTDKIEIHEDAILSTDKVLIHDDLLATGGTMDAAYDLVDMFNPQQIDMNFLVELSSLNGKTKLEAKKGEIDSLLKF